MQLDNTTNEFERGKSQLSAFFSFLFSYKTAVILLAALMVLPIAFLVFVAASGDFESIGHLARTVVPQSSLTTLEILLGVGVMVALVGTFSAWLVSFYDFPGRSIFSWALMLPMAVPTYISAYTFVEFFSYTGPLQTLVRHAGEFSSARDYWFPDIRSVSGTILVMGIVLYPYVYLSTRALFQYQSSKVIDCARSLGAGRMRVFAQVILPMARPAIVLGVALALMETINDIGAVEYLGTRTLTFSIFSVWLNQNDLAGAAQLSLVLLLVVAGLLMLERISRRNRQFHDLRTERADQPVERIRLTGKPAWFAVIGCSLPVAMGFGIPMTVLVNYAARRLSESLNPELYKALFTSLVLAGFAALVAALIGLMFAYALRKDKSHAMVTLVRFASTGYAMPGTILALGIFLSLAMFDNYIDGMFRHYLGISTGLLITGSGATIIYAYVVRFMVMAEGTLDAGLSRISPSIDMAARSLGRNQLRTFMSVLLPNLRPAIAVAALLVMVESIKELSATIMLRPFGIQTLSTHVYDYASQALIEDAALGCLLIVVAGTIPVIVLLKYSGIGDVRN